MQYILVAAYQLVPETGTSYWYQLAVPETDSQPFRTRANLLPGANRPIELWPIRSLELSLSGTFAPGPFRLGAKRLGTQKLVPETG